MIRRLAIYFCITFLFLIIPQSSWAADPYAAAKGAVHVIRQQAEIGDGAARRRERDANSAERQWGRRGEMLVGRDPKRESNIDFAKYGLSPDGQAYGSSGSSNASSYASSYGPPPTRKTGKPKVEMFVASQCSHCDELRKFLREEGVAVRVYDLERDRYAEEDYLANIGRGILPATRIGSKVIRGLEAKKVMIEIERQGIKPQARSRNTPSPTDSFTVGRNSAQSSRSRHASKRGMSRRLGQVLSRYDQAAARLSTKQKDPSIKVVFEEVSKLEVEELLLRSILDGTEWFSKNELSFQARNFEETILTYVNTAKRLAGIAQPGEVSEASLHLLRMRRRSIQKRVDKLRREAGLESASL